MKKIINYLFGSLVILAFLYILTGNSTVRGLNLTQKYTADRGPYNGELYYEQYTSYTSMMCNGYGQPYFFKRTRKVILHSKVHGEERDQDIGSYEPGTYTLSIWGTKEHPDCDSDSVDELYFISEDFSGKGTKTIVGQCQPLKGEMVYATGPIHYQEGDITDVANDIEAFICSEAAANIGPPSKSYVNYAWWNRNEHEKGIYAREEDDLEPDPVLFHDTFYELMGQLSDNAQKEISAEMDRYNDTVARRAEAAKTLKTFKQLIKELEGDILNTQNSKAIKEQEYNNTKKEIKANQNDIRSKERLIQAYQSMKTSKESLKSTKEFAKHSKVALKTTKESAKSQKNALLREKEAQLGRTSSSTAYNNLQREINILRSEINTLNANIAKLTTEINTLTADINRLTNEIKGFDGFINQTRTDIGSLTTKVNNLTNKRDILSGEINELSNSIYSDIRTINDLTYSRRYGDETIAGLEQLIKDLDKEIKTREKNITRYINKQLGIDNTSGTEASQVEQASNTAIIQVEEEHTTANNKGFLHEAEVFDAMHEYLGDKGVKDAKGTQYYNKTVEDLTDIESVKVTYNAATQKYAVGPFKIKYCEVYAKCTEETGEKTVNQFAGITGIPKLTVYEYANPVSKELGDGWRFAYKDTRQTNGTEEVVPNDEIIDEKWHIYPHTGEEFWLEIDYAEGINKLGGISFEFRYLTASATYGKTIEHQIERWKYTLGTVTWDPCEYVEDCDDEDCTDDHECDQFVAASVEVTISFDEMLNTQPGIRVIVAERGFYKVEVGCLYDDTSGVDPSDYSTNFEWDIDLTTSLEGDVWLDIAPQKANDYADGTKDDGEKGVENVRVTIKIYQYAGGDAAVVGNAIMHDESGAEMSWPIYTDSNGHYEITRLGVPAMEGGANCFYVAQFEYDGQVYEHTIFLENGGGDDTAENYMRAKGDGYKDKSMAVENADERRDFDEKFTEITGGNPIQNLQTTGQGSGEINKVTINYEGEYKEDNSYQLEEDKNGSPMVRSEFISPATKDHESMRSPGEWDEEYITKAYTYYRGGTGETGIEKKEYQIMFPMAQSVEYTNNEIVDMASEGAQYGSSPFVYQLNNEKSTNKVGPKRYIDDYMKHINLGLQQRKETDMSLLKDLYKMTVIVNEQQIVQNFNCLGPTADENATIKVEKDNTPYKTLKQVLEARRTAIETNDLGLFASDLTYSALSRYKNAIGEVQEIKKDTELRVFATYAVRIYNNSDKNDVKINEVTDYYDKTYTLISSDVHTSIVDETGERTLRLVATAPYYRILSTDQKYDDISWKPTREDNLKGFEGRSDTLTWNERGTIADMQKSDTTSLKDIQLKKNEYIEIFTTYEIDYNGYIKMSTTNSTNVEDRSPLYTDQKNNIAEISNYTTIYSEKDLQDVNGNEIDYYRPYVKDQVSGKIDKDSAPDNIDTTSHEAILEMKNYEDDTCRAIPINIKIEEHHREMTGYVFEDNKNVDAGQYNIKTGNGIYESGETLINDVKVTMYEVVSLGDINASDNPLDVEYDDLDYYYEVPQEFYNNGEEIITSSGSVADGKGNYNIDGFLAGDYVVRFDYGTRTDSTGKIYTIDEEGVTQEETKGIIKYNGQDYENTSFLSETTYGEANAYSAINDKYLNLRKEDMKTANKEAGIKAVIALDGAKAYSVARDNEARRMVVDAYSRTIENDRGEILRDRIASNEQDNGRYISGTSMFAETPIMQVEVNDPTKLTEDEKYNKDKDIDDITKTVENKKEGNDANTDTYVSSQKYCISNINFGLEERAKTDIKIEEYIESIMLIKDEEIIFGVKLKENEAGQWVVDKTHQSSQHLDKLTSMTRYEAGKEQQGFYSISVEDEFLTGLTMKIDYRIKIINDSETDFTGELADYYVAREIINQAKFAPTTEALTEKINGLLDESSKSGIATNSTLSELLRLYAGDSSTGVLEGLLNLNKDRIINTDDIRENDTLRPDTIVYGKYVGRFYYENKINEGSKPYTVFNYKSKGADRSNIEISYGADRVVKTTINQLINYIDVNASYDLSTQSYENSAWDLSGNVDTSRVNSGERKTVPSLDAIVTEYAYRKIKGKVDDHGDERFLDKSSNIYDEKDKALVTDVSSNIVIAKNNKMEKFDTMSGEYSGSDPTKINSYLTEEINKNWVEYRDDWNTVTSIDNTNLDIALSPKEYAKVKPDGNTSETVMWILTTKSTTSDTDARDLSFDNLVEVLVYSNPTGRRDVYSVPGNAMAVGTAQGFWKAGYNSKDYWRKAKSISDDDTDTEKKYSELAVKEWTVYPEDDGYAPEFVTIIAPTGIALRDYIKNVTLPIIILVVTLLAMAGIFGVKQIKIHKKVKED